jgi:4-aminobutyrate aminotransferase/(S)-3-amino-2-methylpropionate transaminase
MASVRQSLRAFRHIQHASPIVYRRNFASAATATAPASSNSDEKPFFPEEPSGPSLKTSLPGPKSQELAKELDKVFDTRSMNMIGDYNKSFGN